MVPQNVSFKWWLHFGIWTFVINHKVIMIPRNLAYCGSRSSACIAVGAAVLHNRTPPARNNNPIPSAVSSSLRFDTTRLREVQEDRDSARLPSSWDSHALTCSLPVREQIDPNNVRWSHLHLLNVITAANIAISSSWLWCSDLLQVIQDPPLSYQATGCHVSKAIDPRNCIIDATKHSIY